MSGTLSGRGAVVTGGGRGIGAAVAHALARAGAAVLVAARSTEQVEAVAAAITRAGGKAASARCDVTDSASVQALARAAQDRLGPVDILVNNAGVAHSAPLHRITLDDWQRLIAVNATGTFLCTQAFIAAMVERGWGRVINVASIAGLNGAKYIAAYTAAKHAVIGFTRAVAAEVADRGVTVNAVCPGYVDTDMTVDSVERIVDKTGMSRDVVMQNILARSPQKRLITPDEVAHAVLSLCAEEARGITGDALVVDGGSLLQ